ncbi:antitoxin [Streptomyces sp. NBC_00885]|uniref:antitoxin n=1 Tax=Streptomyces sp. NBC_00885 TaxID=2975857 RepID=UPI0038634CDD
MRRRTTKPTRAPANRPARLDKAARAVDAKAKGRYSSKIESGTGKSKDALDRRSKPHTRTTAPRRRPPDTSSTSTDGRGTRVPRPSAVAVLPVSLRYDQAATK